MSVFTLIDQIKAALSQGARSWGFNPNSLTKATVRSGAHARHTTRFGSRRQSTSSGFFIWN